MHRPRNLCPNSLSKFLEFMFVVASSLDCIVQPHRNGRRPQNPTGFTVKRKRPDDAHGRNGRSEIARHAKNAFAKWTHVPSRCSAAFRKNDQTDSLVQCRTRQSPHAL